jgi:hypothetical protein
LQDHTPIATRPLSLICRHATSDTRHSGEIPNRGSNRPITTPFGYFGSAFHADGAPPPSLDNIEQKAGITLLFATAGSLTQ